MLQNYCVAYHLSLTYNDNAHQNKSIDIHLKIQPKKESSFIFSCTLLFCIETIEDAADATEPVWQ